MTRATRIRAGALAMGLVLVGTGVANAQSAANGQGANTFSGTCQLSGTIAFTPPLSNTAQPINQRVQARGTCSGKFTDRGGRTSDLLNAPITYRATEYAPNASCNGGTDSGSGRLTFPSGAIGFTISETRGVAAAPGRLNGAKGGSAAGEANVSPTGNPQQVLTACASSGLPEAPFDGRATTTPSISG